MPETTRRSWRRHLAVLVTATAGLFVLRAADVELLIPVPLFVVAMGAAAFAGTTAYRLWGDVAGGWRLHARILSHVAPVAVLTHLTGWGSALVPLQLVAVAGNVKHGGYRTLRPALAWTTIATLVAEAAVHVGLLPTVLDTSTAHGLAALGAAAVVFIGLEFAHADQGRRNAEERGDVLRADVAQEREKQQWLEAEISWQTRHDIVTGLPNRAHLLELLEEPRDDEVVLLAIGLDGADTLVDVHGAGIANLVHRTTGHRIATSCEPDAVVTARTATTEYVVLLSVPPDGATANAVAQRIARTIAAAVRLPVHTVNGPVHLTASVGVAPVARGATAKRAMLDAAIALHAARGRGVDHIETYDPTAHLVVADRLTLASELRAAVVNQDFDLDYQPIVDLCTGEIVATEALVRWDHPSRGRLGPDTFVPHAERSGHIAQIGRYVLEEAVWQARSWQRDLGDTAPTVAVNLSARQLDERIVGIVEELLDDTMLEPSRLTLELTETALAPGGRDVLRARLQDLKQLGVTLALDDFGTGYSSLEYVEQLPLDVLKIDRTLVARAVDGEGSVARAIVALAHAMGLTTVIEGIETEEQRDLFTQLGCDRAQGYLFAPPLPAPVLTHQLRQAAAATG